MSVNVARYKKRKERISTSRGDYYQLKDGQNVIRVYTFPHTVTQDDFDNGVYYSDDEDAPEIGEISHEIEREVWLHFRGKGEGGPVVCTRDAYCEMCKQVAKMPTGSKADQDAKKRASARPQYYLNIVDAESPTGIKEARVPQMVFEEIIEYLVSGEYESDELFGDNGRDFVITRDSKAAPSKMYRVRLKDAAKCAEYDLQDQAVDLYTVDVVGGSGDAPKQETTKPGRKASSSRGAKKDPPEDDEELEDEEDAEEIPIGTTVQFSFDGDTIDGKITAYDPETGMYDIATADDEFEMERRDFSLAPKKTAKKAKKKVTKKK